MLQKIILPITLIFLLGNTTMAQRVWSLDRCIKHVEASNSPTIRLAKIDVDKAKVLQRKAQAKRQPTVSLGVDLGANFGRVEDPVLGTFENQSIIYNTLYLQGNYSLYDAGRTKKEIERSALEVEVSEAEEQQLTMDMTLEVLQAYLSILLAEEHLENAKLNLRQSNDWYAQMEKKVRGGLISQSDLQTISIQIARDEQAIIERESFINKNYVALKILLEMDPSQQLEIEKPDNIASPEEKNKKLPFSRIYNQALKNQPALKIGDLKVKSAQLEEEIASSSKMPTVSLFGGVWSSYSSATPTSDDTRYETEIDTFVTGFFYDSGLDTYINVEESFERDVDVPSEYYPKQIWDNFGYGVGIRANFPILDQKASQLDSEIAHLNMKQAQEENNELKQRLRGDIQNAIHDIEAAAETLQAIQKTYRLAEESVEFMRKKLSYGNVDAFQLKVAIDEKDDVQTELVIAKYNYLLKKMVIDYYEGRPLEF